MKFAHLADCHIGGWHEPLLKELNLKSFRKAVDSCIEEHVGFVLISGDLFDAALPSIDLLKETAFLLNRLKEYDIQVYLIPGSHDFSFSGKTMLDVLENAGLVTNVIKFESENKLKFTIDKTGTKIVGFYGKKGGLESNEYKILVNQHLESEPGFKIFLFHSLLNELKSNKFESIEGIPISFLPKNFNYYAGGHPHFVCNKIFNEYGMVAYPGPIFPNNFQELEDLKCGGLYIIDYSKELSLKHIKLELIHVSANLINAENKTPKEVEEHIINQVRDFKNKIVTIRIEGCLKSGKTSDIDFNYIKEKLDGCYCLLKNTNKLTTKEFEEIKVDYNEPIDIESSIIEEYANNSKFKISFIKGLMHGLAKEKLEGERNQDFELRVIKDIQNLLNL